ncbi:glycosyltransferase [Vibrio parahaemolyticus]|nr:glycosyltransferase [Vibrio parahaemolyticus]
MRIAIFAERFPVLSQTFIINQIVGLKRLGVDVTILCLNRDNSGLGHNEVKQNNLMDDVVELYPSFSPKKGQRLFNSLLSTLKLISKGRLSAVKKVLLNKYLKSHQKEIIINSLSNRDDVLLEFDHVICHFGVHGYLLASLRDLGVFSGKLSTVFHGYELSRYAVLNSYSEQYNELFLSGDYMLPVCDLYSKKLKALGCDENKIKVVRMGVDTTKFQFRKWEGINIKDKKIRLLQVGRLTPKKAILDSINAVISVASLLPVEFNIIGEGELLSAAKELIKVNNAEAYIHLLGSKNQEEVQHYMQCSDILMLPSVTAEDGDTESIPVCLMEATASGLLVLSTEHSAIPELIEDSITGFLVPESNVKAIVDKLIHINSLDSEQVNVILANARNKCLEKHDNIRINKELNHFYQMIS